jgi:hypothetical protein
MNLIAKLSTDSPISGRAGKGQVCPPEGVAVQTAGGSDAVSLDEEWNWVGALMDKAMMDEATSKAIATCPSHPFQGQ